MLMAPPFPFGEVLVGVPSNATDLMGGQATSHRLLRGSKIVPREELQNASVFSPRHCIFPGIRRIGLDSVLFVFPSFLRPIVCSRFQEDEHIVSQAGTHSEAIRMRNRTCIHWSSRCPSECLKGKGFCAILAPRPSRHGGC